MLLFIKEDCIVCDHIQAFLGFQGLEGSVDLEDVDTVEGFSKLVSFGLHEVAYKELPILVLGGDILVGLHAIKSGMKSRGLVK